MGNPKTAWAGACLIALSACSSSVAVKGAPDGGGAGAAGASGALRIFVTSAPLNIEAFEQPSLAGADQTCTTAAKGGGMTGIWMAVMSDTLSAARTRLELTGPVVNMNGETVATDANDLWDGSLGAAIRYDERGSFVGDTPVWSATNPDGSSAAGSACTNWSEQNGTLQVLVGSAAAKDSKWIANAQLDCASDASLYCLEQP